MNLLIIDDFLFGHKKLNNEIIDALKLKHKITILNCYHYYDDYSNDENVKLVEMKHRLPGYSRQPYKFIGCLYDYFYLCLLIKKRKILFDKVLFLHITNIGISYIYKFFEKKEVYVVDHATLDDLKTEYGKKRFNKYKNLVTHIVLDSFIKQGMSSVFSVREDNIKVLIHPIKSCKVISNKSAQKVIISTGWESDETLISCICEKLKDNNLLKDNNCKVIIRSSSLKYESENLVIFNDVLSEEEYMELYQNASAVLLPYEKSYGYRFSGSAMDALAHNKVLIGRNIPVMQSLKLNYKKNCLLFDECEDLIKIILENNFVPDKDDHIQFLNNHSTTAFIQSLYAIIE